MSVLSAADFAEIRAAFSEAMASTCSIERQDTINGRSQGPLQVVGTDVPCWVVDASGSLNALAASLFGTGTLKVPGARRILFEWDADVQVGDQVVKGSRRYAVREVKRDTDFHFVTLAEVELMRSTQNQ